MAHDSPYSMAADCGHWALMIGGPVDVPVDLKRTTSLVTGMRWMVDGIVTKFGGTHHHWAVVAD